MRQSIDQKISEGKGFTSGFDYLRIGLALGVLTWHCFAVANFDRASALWSGPWRALPAFILPMFFALSGYLVSGSIQRLRLHQFAMARILRIVPALAFETFLVALVMGAVFTTLPLGDYFSSHEFFAYFLNIVGYIHYTLPGVFDGRTMNAQLWTIPAELYCYVALMLAALVGLTGRRTLFALVVATAALVMTFHAFSGETLNPYAPLGGRVLVFSFLAGVLIFLFKDRLPHTFLLFVFCAIGGAILLTFPQSSYLAAFPIAYTTVYLGVLRPPKIPFGDLSYGVYLFHFPIIMMFYQSWGDATPWPLYVAVTLPLAIFCAAVSWFLVEKPILDRKSSIIARADRIADAVGRNTRRRAVGTAREA